ncbi:hypothetical protein SRHO_G00238520 [Serrasalmus rhombeus]
MQVKTQQIRGLLNRRQIQTCHSEGTPEGGKESKMAVMTRKQQRVHVGRLGDAILWQGSVMKQREGRLRLSCLQPCSVTNSNSHDTLTPGPYITAYLLKWKGGGRR